MRFGTFVPQGWVFDQQDIPLEEQWPRLVAAARRAEQLGYESVWVYDHFHTMHVPTRQTTFEAFATMAGLAVATERVRLGQMCTCNSYRPPAYLAKVTSTIDVMSGGRLELGIGAGWYEHEYLGYGYEFPRASVRIAQLAEAVEIIKAMWSNDDVTFSGEHYRLDGAINRPRPIQDPHPPLWIAGGGKRLTLRIVAEHAQWANFGDDLNDFREKQRVLATHCELVGRDPAEIGLSKIFDTFIGETESDARSKWQRTLDKFRAVTPPERHYIWERGLFATAFVGTPAQLVDQIGAWAEAGCDYAIPQFFDTADTHESMELFAAEVIPALA